ncbi:hypothetical protein [Spiroplasma endosymbiont of Dilophus febrilis]|uniref:hypothetical protein n=1 Tax=Spiroplasma endosymbiont of Dilophus febrilis TaxID=3066292 RepID=UPI00313CFCC4
MLFFQNYSNLYPPNKTLCAQYILILYFYLLKSIIFICYSITFIINSTIIIFIIIFIS